MTVLFTAYANSNNIVLDSTYLADPIEYSIPILIQNQSTQDLYFKVVVGNPNWSLVSPTNGELGSVGATTSSAFGIKLQRTKPTTDVVETIPLTIEAYTDSGYTNKVDEGSLDVNITIANIRNWANVTIYDFDDGTAQGWTLGSGWSVSNAASVQPGGYSLEYYNVGKATFTGSVSLTTTLPTNAKVAMNLLMAAKFNPLSTKIVRLNYIKIKVNGNDVFMISNMSKIGYEFTGASDDRIHVYDWANLGVDLSAYAGQTVTINIEVSVYSDYYANKFWIWIDDIIIAGNG